MTDDLEQRIARRAHAIWEREGRPEGKDREHWELASEEIAIEDNQAQTLRPNPSHGPRDTARHTEPVEPVLSLANQGEMPGLADQGEESQIPGGGDRTPMPQPDRTHDDAGAAAPAPRRPRRRAGG